MHFTSPWTDLSLSKLTSVTAASISISASRQKTSNTDIEFKKFCQTIQPKYPLAIYVAMVFQNLLKS